jgi:hypothetical protein
MNSKFLGAFAVASVLLVALACSSQRAGQNGTTKDNASYKNSVETSSSTG